MPLCGCISCPLLTQGTVIYSVSGDLAQVSFPSPLYPPHLGNECQEHLVRLQMDGVCPSGTQQSEGTELAQRRRVWEKRPGWQRRGGSLVFNDV